LEKCRDGKPLAVETVTQYAARLCHYFDLWVKFAAFTKDFDSLLELVIKKQFRKGLSSKPGAVA
ncbi:hypothetical protein HPB47_027595, partial [Ixodes persulcatus]